ncbi:unnamed protein product, partial [Mesorhabditis spiculigera]
MIIRLLRKFLPPVNKRVMEPAAKRSKSPVENKRFVWIDCEMTGLEPETQTLVEIATIVTDQELNIIAEGPDIVIHQPEDVLEKMSDWCKLTFSQNGLTEKIRNSQISLQEAENQTMTFLEKHTAKGKSPLAGNTVYMDRLFLRKYMPRLNEHLHYRIVDVSSVKELTRRWYPQEYRDAPEKKGTHRALDDIRESIEELKFYRSNVFKP